MLHTENEEQKSWLKVLLREGVESQEARNVCASTYC